MIPIELPIELELQSLGGEAFHSLWKKFDDP